MSLEERVKFADMKARHKNILRPWYKKWWGILVSLIGLIALIAIIAAGIYVVQTIINIRSGTDQTNNEQQRQQYLASINGGQNYFTGTSTPQVTIIEFGDFACPFCLASEAGLNQIRAKYANQIKLIWRDYPLHPTSIDLALAARCAGEQGKFWSYHDLLFADQDKMATSSGTDLNTQLNVLAQSLSLNTGAFASCLSSQKYLDQIRKDYNDGETLQVQGTPTWFINNYPITGAIAADQFPTLIQGLIK